MAPPDRNRNKDPQYNGDNNYGYTPYTGGPYGGYGSEDSARNDTYSKTDLGNTNDPSHLDPTKWSDSDPDIDTMMSWIKMESDGSLNGAAGLWEQFTNKLTAVRDDIVRTSDDLAGGGAGGKGAWPPSKSVASAAFLQQVGKATYSLDEWIMFSGQNAQALRSVAKQVASSRTEMKKIYATYVQEHNAAVKALNEHQGDLEDDKDQGAVSRFFTGSRADEDKDNIEDDRKAMDAAKAKATKAGQTEMKKLASSYLDSWVMTNEGTKYKGPLKGPDPMQALANRLSGLMGGGPAVNPGGATAAQQAALQHQQLLMQQQVKRTQMLIAQQRRQQQQLIQQQQQRLAQQQARQAAELARQQEALRAQQEALARQQAELSQQQLALQQQLAAQQQQIALQQQALQQQMGQLGLQVGPGPGGGQTVPGLRSYPGINGPGSPSAVSPNLNRSLFPGGQPGQAGMMPPRSGLNGLGGRGGLGGGPAMRPPMMGRPQGTSGLRGRLGGPNGGDERANGRAPLGGRGDNRRPGIGSPGERRAGVPAESEEYLGETPTAPELLEGRLGNTEMPGASSVVPPRPSIPGRAGGPGIPGARGPGGRGPMMPGAPRGTRSLQSEELAGRRKRMSDAQAEADEELMTPPLLMQPDLTGRNGMPEIDWEKVGSTVGAESEMLGTRGAAARTPVVPGMAERLAARNRKSEQVRNRKPEQKEDADQSESAVEAVEELWTVRTPEVIDTPTEHKVEHQPGRVLGTG